ncbi:MAG: hypothetical protein NTX56_10105 [Proteobacteria bacterium]|nr:hypothetical protein [Pseudomonadota bacterium]
MTTEQVAALTAATIAVLDTQQIQAFSSADIAVMSPEQYAAISAADLVVLTNIGSIQAKTAQGMRAPRTSFTLSDNVSSLTNAISVFSETPVERSIPKLLVDSPNSTNMGVAVSNLVNALNQFNVNPIDNGVVTNVPVLNGTQPQQDLSSLLAATRA